MPLTPSPQQAAIFNWVENGTGSAVIEAVAGAGKTTTLLMALEKTKGSVAFTAFNKAIADEIKLRLKDFRVGGRVNVNTMHSFGYAAIRAAYPGVRMDGSKVRMIVEALIKKGVIKEFFYKSFIIAAVSKAKQVGIGVTCSLTDPNEWGSMVAHYSLDASLPGYAKLSTAISYAQEVLRVSNLNASKVIDYDDMVYIPVLNDLPMRKYNWVLLDESQDANVMRRKLVGNMLAPGGRLAAVGDSHQAIYGFTGADHESMDNIRKTFNCINLPLTVSYRCPRNVVSVANQWVSHIQATDSAPEGIVDNANFGTLLKNKEFSEKDVILCRKTKPLVELAFRLIQNGIPCRVEGRGIGEGLISLAKKWKVANVGELVGKLNTWKAREIEKAVAKDDYSRCNYVEDQVETLEVIIENCELSDPISVLVEEIRSFFGDTENGNQEVLTLSTIHRAKGKEWDRVFVLDMDKHSPSRWARQPWEIAQEVNLCYVQVTRAKKHLTFLSLDSGQSRV